MAESKARNTDPRYSKLTIGVCPDQWGGVGSLRTTCRSTGTSLSTRWPRPASR